MNISPRLGIKIPSTIIILLFANNINSQVANELPITHTTQECDLTCWAACNIMLFEHYFSNKFQSQCEQLNQYYRNQFDCCLPNGRSNCEYEDISDIDYNSLQIKCKSQKFYNYNTQPSAVVKKALFDLIKAQIDSNQVVVAQLIIGIKKHLILITGYLITNFEDSLILVNNPASAEASFLNPSQLIYSSPNIHLNYIQYSIQKKVTNDLQNFNLFNESTDNPKTNSLAVSNLKLLLDLQNLGTINTSGIFKHCNTKDVILLEQSSANKFLFSKSESTFNLYQHQESQKYYYLITEFINNDIWISECGSIASENLLTTLINNSNYMTRPAISTHTLVLPVSNNTKNPKFFNNYNNDFKTLKTKIKIR